MKGKRIATFCAALVVLCCAATPAQAISVKARGAVVMDADSGRLIFSQEEHRELAMASTTKIMTALITLEQPGLDEPFTVDAEAIRVEGSSMGLTEGDTVTLRALAAGMLLPSGNDAANAAAVRIAGSRESFIKMMNERALELGLEHTAFVTPSGLDAEGHYSTAYDMAALTRAALRNDDFAALCSQYSMSLEFGNPPYKRWLKNHNKLLNSYDGAIGVKTGFTDAAGRCLVSAARRDGVTLICVTLNNPDDWRDHTALLDYGFEQVKSTDLSDMLPVLSLPVGGGVRASVEAVPAQTVCAALMEGERERVRTEVLLEPFVLAPAQAGTAVGEIRVTLDGMELLRTPLCLTQDVDARPVKEKEKGLFAKLWDFVTGRGGAPVEGT